MKTPDFIKLWGAMLREALVSRLAAKAPDDFPRPLRPPEDIVIRSRSRYWPNEEDRKHAASGWNPKKRRVAQ